LDLLRDLALQRDVSLIVHVVECGDDGTLARALNEHSIKTTLPGENVGYCGGNNLVLRTLMNSESPLCIVNPDVTLPDPLTMEKLRDVLQSDPALGAVAPSIRTAEGQIEYTGSTLDLSRASAVHTGTHVPSWPPDAPAVTNMAWIDGACWMIRPQALRDVGLLDERFFLFSEDVDWCLRATGMGWKLGVLRDAEVVHQRSSSFHGSTKGAYYYWRNTYLLSMKHQGYGRWLLYWLGRFLYFALQRGHIRSGQSRAALRGARDAVLHRGGRMPDDA
jgi:hypothetical protein